MDKRASKRIPFSLEGDLVFHGTIHKALIGNISAHGMHVIVVPGIGNIDVREVSPIAMKLHVSSGQFLNLQCNIISFDNAADHSTTRMYLEIPNPPAEFKKFYKDTYYKVRNEASHDAIAVIGMACRYPGAPNIKDFWENILARRREFRRFPDQRLPLSEYYDSNPVAPDKTYANRAAVIDGFEFDWIKRGIPKTVVESSDIVHWLALEIALRALEDAGYSRSNMPCDRTGVIVGNTLTGEHSRSQYMRLRWPYVKKVLKAAAAKRRLSTNIIDQLIDTMEVYYKAAFAPITEDTLAGNLSNTIAGRICNFLDLRGGGYTVDGACSSSLIAIATAATALSSGTLDVAVVGGIDISLDTFELIGFAKTNALTKGDMQVYDRYASGFIPGEGAGFVVLKRLEDARVHGNKIYAVLEGWGISSDGKGGMTAPKAQTQALAIQRAYGKAGYSLRDVDFIEGHGTGTKVGDKAELEGIALAMDDESTDSLRSCGITSLKSLIGHTKAASGIGGFIKAVMAVNRHVIPPTAGCKEPNMVFYEKAHRVFPVVQGEIRSAEDSMRAGISSMGFGGINCHVTIESAGEPSNGLEPSIGERELLVSYQETELFVLSAESRQEMADRLKDLKNLVEGMSSGEMVDLSSYLTGVVSADKPFRVATVATSPEGLLDCLERLEQMLSTNPVPKGETMSGPQQDIWVGNSVSRNRVGFLFPGQGSQQLNMGRRLIERYPWAREFRDEVESWLSDTPLKQLGASIYRPLDRALNIDQIEGWKKELSRAEIAQPAICMTSLLWMRQLGRLGIKPAAAGGHSLGELTAFRAAGAFDDRSLLLFAAMRGRVTSAHDGNPGIMASFACGRKKVEDLLTGIEGYAVVANINSPTQTVISGERAAVQHAMRLGSNLGIRTKRLAVANAFHSRFMASAADSILHHAPIPETLEKTTMKLLTSMGGWEVSAELDLRAHFARQVTNQTDFVSTVDSIGRECDLLLEVGPGSVLSHLVYETLGADGTLCFPVEETAGDDRSLNVFLACYFVHGGHVNWNAFFENRLVRPFIPASNRIFIDNPCERSLASVDDDISPSLLAHDTQRVMGSYGDKDDTNESFTGKQIAFIRELIRRETMGMGVEPKNYSECSPEKTTRPTPTVPAGTVEPRSLPLNYEDRSPEGLLKLAAAITGFPKDSISLDHRLLDDLNLDSIKASQFVAKAVKLYGAKGVDPTTMANSSIREIYDSIKLDVSLGQTNQTSFGTEERKRPSELSPRREPAYQWVRTFRVTYVEQQREALAPFKGIASAESLNNRRFLFIHDDVADSLAQEMQGLLSQRGVSAVLMDYRYLLSCSLEDYKNFDNFVFLLPRKKNVGFVTREQVSGMAARMHCIGTIINAMKMKAQKPTYAIVQFGYGGFHKYDPAVSIESKGSTAFLCSIYLENPSERIRVMEFCETSDVFGVLEQIIGELHAHEKFSMAAFDTSFVRHVPMVELSESKTFRDRKISWTHDDVVLVTGGAKGITAECALEFAKRTNVKLAIVGGTALIDTNEEIQKVLRRYRESGISYRYYACDISDRQSATDLKKRIEQDLGLITGVVHGAAINKPHRAEHLTLSEALQEIAPKLLGTLNICEALQDCPPKLFVGFSSIIGITGMMGNAWYGFSNEVMNLLLQAFESSARTPEVISLAYSIWGEVGMGQRMGSLTLLSSMGIHPISKEQGVEYFMRLVEQDPGDKLAIVTSRLGELKTLQRPAISKPDDLRFLEEILVFEKGVEIEAKAVLTLEKDAYLKDHAFRGVHLLPAVFGIEAMAQAVFFVTGIDDVDYMRLENVQLTYPITVESAGAAEVRIRAVVEDTPSGRQGIRVKASITFEQTGFSKNHFEATFILGEDTSVEQYAVTIPASPLDIKPMEDLYGHSLFQGPMFQRIRAVRSLEDSQCSIDCSSEITRNSFKASLGRLVMGDPFFRDTLLQAAQIIVTDFILLPVEIDRWEMSLKNAQKGTHTVVADIVQRSKDIVNSAVVAINRNGEVVERLHGYKTKIVEKVPNPPQIADLKEPDAWDESRIDDKLRYFCRKVNQVSPAVSIRHQSGLHEMDRTRRHEVERELFERAYGKLRSIDGRLPEEITIAWTREGRPFVKEPGTVCASCSHDDRLLLCVVGHKEQGCDVETITHRSADDWVELLGMAREPLLRLVTGMDGSLDRAGSRIWCALESIRKATNMKENDLSCERPIEECLMFKGGDVSIMTFPVKLLRGGERMVAVVLANEDPYRKEEPKAEDLALAAEHPTWGKFIQEGLQGQQIFSYQFPLSLKDSSTIGGGVYFANYFHWLGRVREMMLRPISKNIADKFFSGDFMVTNFTETQISGHVRNHEIMDARAWVHKMFGTNDSSLLLHFEWRKLLPGGRVMRVAFSRQQLSWVKAIGHGLVKPMACPAFFADFLKKNGILPTGDSAEMHDILQSTDNVSLAKLGNVIYEADLLGGDDILEESVFDTTMEHANLAQNVYFSNYFTWLGGVRDRYLFNLSPDLYRKMNSDGQLVCIFSQVKHLRESMPFDRISVVMKLKRLYECGIDLYFEYFRMESGAKKVKLANAQHIMAWVLIDRSDNYIPQKLPALYATKILNGYRQNQGSYGQHR